MENRYTILRAVFRSQVFGLFFAKIPKLQPSTNAGDLPISISENQSRTAGAFSRGRRSGECVSRRTGLKEVESIEVAKDATLKQCDGSLEVTGLGMIVALMITFSYLVYEDALPLSEYLVFVAFLLVSAGGLVWRTFKLVPTSKVKVGDLT